MKRVKWNLVLDILPLARRYMLQLSPSEWHVDDTESLALDLSIEVSDRILNVRAELVPAYIRRACLLKIFSAMKRRPREITNFPLHVISDYRANPTKRLERKDFVLYLMNHLSEEEKRLFYEHFWKNRSVYHIANSIGRRSRTTAYNIMGRSLGRLRQIASRDIQSPYCYRPRHKRKKIVRRARWYGPYCRHRSRSAITPLRT